MPFVMPRRPLLVTAGWLLAAVVLLPLAATVEESLEVQARIPDSESAQVEEALRTRFASPFAVSALCVLGGAPPPSSPEGRRVLEATVAALLEVKGVTRTLSWLDQPDPLFVGRDGRGTFVVVGLDPAGGRVDRLVPKLRRAGTLLAPRLVREAPGLSVRFTGEGPINFDLWRTSTDEARRAERRTLPLTLGLLVLAFGAIGAALIPVAFGALAVGLALGLVALVAARIPLSIVAVNVTSMLGLALGIDYALLTVSRFREALLAGEEPRTAAATAGRHAGATVALAGAPVAIGFLALLLVPLDEMRSAALGGLAVALVSVLLSTTLLPALLGALGRRVDAGRLFEPAARSAGYRRMAQAVVRRPVLVLALSAPLLLVLASEARRLSPTVPRGRWLPPAMESAQGERDLEAMGRVGVLHSLRVLVDLPDPVQALDRAGWAATRRLSDTLARDPRVEAVRSLRGLPGELDSSATSSDATERELAAVAFLPSFAKRAFLSEEGDGVLLELIPREGLGGRAQIALVRDLRRLDAAAVVGIPGARLRVGGLPAFAADYEDAVAGRFPLVVGLVVLGTLIALFAGFRSLLVPVKAILLNLLTVGAAMGALVLVFQDGHGARFLGLEGPVDGVFPIVPALVFCSVFGLSMDYEVFLVARVRESLGLGMAEDEAIVEGVARTGPLITSAAAVMIAVFGTLVLGDFVLMKMLGFTLAVAVLLDATLIRLFIGPALLCLAGRLNWWPGDPRVRDTRLGGG